MVVFRVLIVAYFCDLWFLVVFGVLNFAYFCDLQIAVFWDVKFCLFLMILTIWRKIGVEMECLGMKWHERWWILVKSVLKRCIIHYSTSSALVAYELVFFNKECIMQHTLKKLTY